jgi:hypothetical protein
VAIGKALAMRIQSSPAHFTAIQPGTAKTPNPHKSRPAHRGFVPRGLSDAKRHPKLFTRGDWLLSVIRPEEAVHQRVRVKRQNSTQRGRSRPAERSADRDPKRFLHGRRSPHNRSCRWPRRRRIVPLTTDSSFSRAKKIGRERLATPCFIAMLGL